jgi:cell division protein FtsB
MYDVLDKLLEMVRDASVSPDDCTGGFHLSEPLIVLVKLFNDDHTLDYIMEHARVDLHTSSSTEFFINLLIKYHSTIGNEGPLKQATSTALVNILWSISFQGRYKQKLKNANTKFKELINNLTNESNEKIVSNQYVPQYLENIRKAAKGLLFNIDELIHPETEQLDGISAKLGNNQKPMIMISYSHADTHFCTQLYNEILKRGYDIWIDFEFIKTGDLWETIAVGMKQSRIIVCLMSETYFQSKSCRLEAIYALDKLQGTKSVIPVFLQKHELPLWLGKLDHNFEKDLCLI